jgi:uroporphyrinogen decarboxylase
MNQLKNDRFLKAIWREPVDATPIWVMRQAGRYLPEYRAIRAKAGSFMTLCQTPELACEVTLQPLRRYDLDAAIIFSDILTIPHAMGLGLSFVEGEGPQFAHPLQTEAAIKRLTVPDLANLTYVYDAIRLVRHELQDSVPLIGFCGSPWTVAAYMVQGRSCPGFPLIRDLLRENPQLLHQLLHTLAQSIGMHLNAQIEAGAQAVMLFDTWGGLLSTPDYEEFSLRYIKQIIAGLKRDYPGINGTPLDQPKKIPVILFTKGGGERLYDLLADSGCDVVGVDDEVSLKQVRDRIGNKVVLQGNLSPACMTLSPDEIRVEVKRVLESFGSGSGHIFNLGHGITPDVPPENVAVLVNAVHELSRA